MYNQFQRGPIVLTMFLLMASTTAYPQADKADKAECKRIANSNIKSCTRTAYNYYYDLNSQSRKPSEKGKRILTDTYDEKGNVVKEVYFDDYGNVQSRSDYKYDARGNQTEEIVYSSDGIMQSKSVNKFDHDTNRLVKYFDGGGKNIQTLYSIVLSSKESRDIVFKTIFYIESKHSEEPYLSDSGNIFLVLEFHDAKDSSLAAVKIYAYDPKGNLLLDYTFKGNKMVSGETFRYNTRGQRIENTHHDEDDNWTGSQKFKYDESGYLVETLQTGSGGLPTSLFSYKNDSKGNPLKCITYNSENVPQQLVKYSYQYNKQE